MFKLNRKLVCSSNHRINITVSPDRMSLMKSMENKVWLKTRSVGGWHATFHSWNLRDPPAVRGWTISPRSQLGAVGTVNKHMYRVAGSSGWRQSINRQTKEQCLLNVINCRLEERVRAEGAFFNSACSKYNTNNWHHVGAMNFLIHALFLTIFQHTAKLYAAQWPNIN